MTEYPAKIVYQDRTGAECYDRVRFSSLRGRLVDALEKRAVRRALLYVPTSAFVLDLPCGTGRITQLILEDGYHAAGADISLEMLDQARKRLGQYPKLLGLTRCEAENLPYPDGSFDSVVCVRLMGHVPPLSRIKMLGEMKRVASGPLVVTYYLWNAMTETRRFLLKRMRKVAAPWFPSSPWALKAEIAQAGLEIARVYPIAAHLSEAHVCVLRPTGSK